MSGVSTQHRAATASTASAQAGKMARNQHENAAAMWAACALMALHETPCRAVWLRLRAGWWADSARFGVRQ